MKTETKDSGAEMWKSCEEVLPNGAKIQFVRCRNCGQPSGVSEEVRAELRDLDNFRSQKGFKSELRLLDFGASTELFPTRSPKSKHD